MRTLKFRTSRGGKDFCSWESTTPGTILHVGCAPVAPAQLLHRPLLGLSKLFPGCVWLTNQRRKWSHEPRRRPPLMDLQGRRKDYRYGRVLNLSRCQLSLSYAQSWYAYRLPQGKIGIPHVVPVVQRIHQMYSSFCRAQFST
jgi:hypothetical protein